jgi:hypothetical protein
VALGAWLTITLLPPLQTYYTGKAQRAGALAAGKGAEISAMLEVDGARALAGGPPRCLYLARGQRDT